MQFYVENEGTHKVPFLYLLLKSSLFKFKVIIYNINYFVIIYACLI